MGWIDALLGRTRAELLSLLRRSRRSINELADALGITDNAVRTHVAAMQRDGMVRSAGEERSTGGKPAQLYEITPEAEEMYPKAYAAVLGGLLDVLEERRGSGEVVELLREVGVRAAGGQEARGSSLDERVAAAAAMLERLGGDVVVERAEDGWTIRGFGCPLSAVVGEHSEACALAESLVARITDRPVTECCDRGERPRCAFRIQAEASAP